MIKMVMKMKTKIVPTILMIFVLCLGIPYAYQREINIETPFINQLEEGAPNGCEGASLLMALRGKGKAYSVKYRTFLDKMPYTKDGNPHHGFTGSPYQNKAFSVIYPDALLPYASHYGIVKNTSGSTVKELLYHLSRGRPSVVWVTSGFKKPRWKTYSFGNAVSNVHVATLTGYKASTDTIIVMDPLEGKKRVDAEQFKESYDAMKFALTIY